MATNEECISLTPNGRDIRRIIRDGKEIFIVQPPDDNYWVEARTPLAAMRKAGWPKKVLADYTGDWKAW